MARPRSEEANRAALDATVDVLIERGIEGVTWEEVSTRSGVAKTTLYRHFADREDMIAGALRGCVVHHPTPDTGSLVEDLRIIFETSATHPAEARLNQLVPILLDSARREDRFESVIAELIESRRRPIRTVLQLAQLRGEIDADLDIDDAYALIVGPFTYKHLVEGAQVTDEFRERVLAWTLAGLVSTSPSPTPG